MTSICERSTGCEKLSAVDLYCGVGGLTHGFVREGISVVAGIDVDATCKYAYEKNNGAEFVHKGVEALTAEEIVRLYPAGHTKILVGCAPCQPFSRYTIKPSPGEKWKLLFNFVDFIRDVKPEIVSMENVPDLIRHGVFKEFVASLTDNDYHVSYSAVKCVEYGVPQTRERLVLFASRLGGIEIIPPTHPNRGPDVRETIGSLEPIAAGETHRSDPLHRASALNEINLRRIKASKPGGSWRNWPEDLKLECHKKKTGRSFGSVYGRMSWDEPAPTITTQCNGIGNGRFGHPDQDRAISLREAALIQTFPMEYEFIEPGAAPVVGDLARHIGNAVPVRLGEVIARTIKEHVASHNAA